MKLRLKVVPNARKNQIVEENGLYKVRLNASAVGGKANSALIEFLSEHFNIKKSSIRIVKGQKSRNKVVEIIGDVRV